MTLSLRDLPIKRKLMLVTVLTSGAALLAVCIALITYERMRPRECCETRCSQAGRANAKVP